MKRFDSYPCCKEESEEVS